MEIPEFTWLSPKIKVIDSSIEGKGMFATCGIKEGEIIVIWGGCYTDRIGALQKRQEDKGVMQWDEDVFSYETTGDDDPYSINHRCDPNSWMSDAFTIIARRTIIAGEEITADYALWETNESFVSTWKCNCGSVGCRGEVRGKDWRNPELQKRYRGHFSPLINKRIAGDV